MTCPAVSTHSRDGVGEWTYHCSLDEGHHTTTDVTDVSGHVVTLATPTDHEYVLDDGQTPPPAVEVVP